MITLHFQMSFNFVLSLYFWPRCIVMLSLSTTSAGAGGKDWGCYSPHGQSQCLVDCFNQALGTVVGEEAFDSVLLWQVAVE